MIELALLGSHADGTQLVFTDPEGQRYLVTIDDSLKAAIRRESLRLESLPDTTDQLRPGQIQQLLRAGLSPAEIASTYDIEIARINRFLAPVTAEKNFIISRALESGVSREPGSPLLGELVVDRLATRGVDTANLNWEATREQGGPWNLHLTFAQSARTHQASWELTEAGTIVRALDDESRWLTETTAPTPATPGASASSEQAEDDDKLEALLDELAAARGRRQRVSEVDGEESEREATVMPGPFQALRNRVSSSARAKAAPVPATDHQSPAPASTSSADSSAPTPDTPWDEADAGGDGAEAAVSSAGSAPSPARPTHSDQGAPARPESARPESARPESARFEPTQADPAQAGSADEDERRQDQSEPTLPGLENSGESSSAPNPPAPRSSRKRRSVPSWDEIVFGSRNDG